MMDESDISATFWEHVEALRLLIIQLLLVVGCAFALCFFFYKQIFALLTSPLSAGETLVLLAPTEGLTTVLKCCFWAGSALSSPLWLYRLFRFFSPALRYKEKKLVMPFLMISLLFFSGGISFAYAITLPIALHYLEFFNAGIGVNLWSVAYYFDFTLLLLLANGIAFEGVVILLFLVHFGLISPYSMARRRREVLLAILLIAAILTPPDVLTQILLAIPLQGLYELAILYGKMRERRSHRIIEHL